MIAFESFPGNLNQYWRYVRCEPVKDPTKGEIIKETQSEVMTYDEDENFLYTTCTTTHTTVAVIKTSKQSARLPLEAAV